MGGNRGATYFDGVRNDTHQQQQTQHEANVLHTRRSLLT